MKKNIFSFIFSVGISTFLLTGCFGPVKVEPSNRYVINSVPYSVTKYPTRKINILVTQPTTTPIYNTEEIAYSTYPHQIAYFSKNHWADTPANMLQPLLVQTLQNTHYFYAVGSAPSIGNYDFVLNTQILQLEQKMYPCTSYVYLRLRAQLINAATNQIIATKQFTVVETAPQRNPYGGVKAANRATSRVLSQVARFCLQKLR